jgi:hypothetical protein
MMHEQSTSAAAADPHATSLEQRTTEHIRTVVLASEQRITEQFLAANAALLAQLQHTTATLAFTDQQQSIPADATPATEGGKAAPEPPSTCLTTNSTPPRPISSISPTTAKSSRPASNLPLATSRSHVCGHSPMTPPEL